MTNRYNYNEGPLLERCNSWLASGYVALELVRIENDSCTTEIIHVVKDVLTHKGSNTIIGAVMIGEKW